MTHFLLLAAFAQAKAAHPISLEFSVSPTIVRGLPIQIAYRLKNQSDRPWALNFGNNRVTWVDVQAFDRSGKVLSAGRPEMTPIIDGTTEGVKSYGPWLEPKKDRVGSLLRRIDTASLPTGSGTLLLTTDLPYSFNGSAFSGYGPAPARFTQIDRFPITVVSDPALVQTTAQAWLDQALNDEESERAALSWRRFLLCDRSVVRSLLKTVDPRRMTPRSLTLVAEELSDMTQLEDARQLGRLMLGNIPWQAEASLERIVKSGNPQVSLIGSGLLRRYRGAPISPAP